MLVGMALAVIPALLLLALDDDRTLGHESEGLLTAAAAAAAGAAEAGTGGGAARGRDRGRSGSGGRGRSSSNAGGLQEPLLGASGKGGEGRGGGRGRASREGQERRGGGRLSVVSAGRCGGGSWGQGQLRVALGNELDIGGSGMHRSLITPRGPEAQARRCTAQVAFVEHVQGTLRHTTQAAELHCEFFLMRARTDACCRTSTLQDGCPSDGDGDGEDEGSRDLEAGGRRRRGPAGADGAEGEGDGDYRRPFLEEWSPEVERQYRSQVGAHREGGREREGEYHVGKGGQCGGRETVRLGGRTAARWGQGKGERGTEEDPHVGKGGR